VSPDFSRLRPRSAMFIRALPYMLSERSREGLAAVEVMSSLRAFFEESWPGERIRAHFVDAYFLAVVNHGCTAPLLWRSRAGKKFRGCFASDGEVGLNNVVSGSVL